MISDQRVPNETLTPGQVEYWRDRLTLLAKQDTKSAESFRYQKAEINTLCDMARLALHKSYDLAGWGIDVKSTGTPILTYNKCSVIQDEQAYLVMRALRAELREREAVPVTLNLTQARTLLDTFGGEDGIVSIARFPDCKDEDIGEFMQAGLYAWFTEHPEEGRIYLGADDAEIEDARPPSPEAQAGKWVPTKEQIISALQTSWDEWVADTGCIPDDFTLYTRGKVSFQAGNWARQVADQLLSAAPDPQPEAQAGKVVPLEPTYEMVQAGAKLVADNLPYHTGTKAIYEAMIAAAPESEGRKP